MASSYQQKPGKAKTESQFYSDLGKVPPNASDIEQIVLGQLMIEPDAAMLVIDILKPESFYKESHQLIYGAIKTLASKDEPVNIITITEELHKLDALDKCGGPGYITELSSRVSSAALVEYNAKLIAHAYIKRELIRVTSEIQNKAFDPALDVSDLIDFSENEMFKIAEGTIKKDSAPIAVLINEALKQIEEAGKREDGLSGVPTGFTELDRLTSGFQKSDMIVIAARPSMGKTAFILSTLRNMAVDHKVPVAMFSLEMANLQLVNRLIVSETELEHDKIKNGRLTTEDWTRLEERTKALLDAPIFLDDTPALSIFEFRAKCRRLKQKHNIQCVFVDYLQLMSAPNAGSREQEISTISRQLKAVAKELNIPVIALSQLNRSVDTQKDFRPQLSNLRESGAIEQDADIVCFIHRPEYYKITEDQEGNSLIGVAEIIVAKHRNGAVGDVRLRFEKEFAKFVDYNSAIPSAGDFSFANAENPMVSFQSKMNTDNTTISGGKDVVNPFKYNEISSSEPAPF